MYRCIKDFNIEKYDEHCFPTGEYSVIESGTEWEIDDDVDMIGGNVHLEKVYGTEWIEISYDTLNEYFEEIEVEK